MRNEIERIIHAAFRFSIRFEFFLLNQNDFDIFYAVEHNFLLLRAVCIEIIAYIWEKVNTQP